MIVNVKDIPITGKKLTGEIEKHQLQLNMKLLQSVLMDGKISKSGEDVFIKGKITANVEVSCHRCLEPFSLPLESDLDLFYQSYKEIEENSEDYELNPEELGVLFYKDNHIDLSKAIRDTIILEIPMKLLCQKDCLGLCVKCGTNRNQKKCNCVDESAGNNPFKDFFQKSSS